MNKRCIVCQVEFELSDVYFHKNRRNKDQYDNTCKTCKNAGKTLHGFKRISTSNNYQPCAEFQFPEKYICSGCPRIKDRPFNVNWENDYVNKIIMTHSLELLIELPSDSIDLIVMDPPYGDAQTCIVNNIIIGSEYVHELFRVLKTGGALYSFTSLEKMVTYSTLFEKYFQVNTPLIWNKRALQMGNEIYDYATQCEAILYCSKGQHKLECGRIGNLLDFGKVTEFHPHQKPVDLICKLLTNSSKENDLVLDPFAGSGSTLVAAKQLNRRYIGIELDKKWYDEAISRLVALDADKLGVQIKGTDSTIKS